MLKPAPAPGTARAGARLRHLLGVLSPGLITGAADRSVMGEAATGWLSRAVLALTFLGVAGSVLAIAVSYLTG